MTPPPDFRARLLGLSVGGPVTLEAFVRLRRELTGVDLPLAGLRALIDSEPALAERLQTRILPAIARHARALVAAGAPPLVPHEAGQTARTRVPREQVAGWIALMLLGALRGSTRDHPPVDFTRLLSERWPSELAKLRCLLAYFDRIAEAAPRGQIEIERVVAPARSPTEWADDPAPLMPLVVHQNGVIEDAAGHRQVDFANRYLGGGVLSGGCVQEEIRFAVAPELLVGMIVSPRMREDEAIVLRGAERFTSTTGYARSLCYGGWFDDPCERAADGTPDIELVAIDAVDYGHADAAAQFTDAAIWRELGKARAGFLRDARLLPVATGNWGCGAFGGDPPLKAVIQWLAASAEGRELHYFTFGDQRVGDLAGFAANARAHHAKVGALFQRLRQIPDRRGAALYQSAALRG